MQLKVFFQGMERKSGKYYIDSRGSLWIDSDPHGVDMSNHRRIHMADQNEWSYQIILENDEISDPIIVEPKCQEPENR